MRCLSNTAAQYSTYFQPDNPEEALGLLLLLCWDSISDFKVISPLVSHSGQVKVVLPPLLFVDWRSEDAHV